MTNTPNAGDRDREPNDERSHAEWVGDIAWRTLERLDTIRGELATLAQQLELLRSQWSEPRGESSAAYMLERYRESALHLGNPAALADLVHQIAESTGRDKQPYHN